LDYKQTGGNAGVSGCIASARWNARDCLIESLFGFARLLFLFRFHVFFVQLGRIVRWNLRVDGFAWNSRRRDGFSGRLRGMSYSFAKARNLNPCRPHMHQSAPTLNVSLAGHYVRWLA
jgi:hypothetical protein